MDRSLRYSSGTLRFVLTIACYPTHHLRRIICSVHIPLSRSLSCAQPGGYGFPFGNSGTMPFASCDRLRGYATKVGGRSTDKQWFVVLLRSRTEFCNDWFPTVSQRLIAAFPSIISHILSMTDTCLRSSVWARIASLLSALKVRLRHRTVTHSTVLSRCALHNHRTLEHCTESAQHLPSYIYTISTVIGEFFLT